MTLYRKKPVQIEAWHFEHSNFDEQPDWLGEALFNDQVIFYPGNKPYYKIRTLEGEMRAQIGDWIIRGIKGEIYPCKPDIFDATYEKVE